MSDQYLGEIRMFPYNFPPLGWTLCNGQVLPISQFSALFALIGTTYGGDGETTFALPNLQSRVPVHQGRGPGLSQYLVGQSGGVETVTLTQNELPAHTHQVQANGAVANATRPAGAVLARTTNATYAASPDGSTTLDAATLTPTGGNQPHTVVQPYLAFSFCIALQGIFPSRN